MYPHCVWRFFIIFFMILFFSRLIQHNHCLSKHQIKARHLTSNLQDPFSSGKTVNTRYLQKIHVTCISNPKHPLCGETLWWRQGIPSWTGSRFVRGAHVRTLAKYLFEILHKMPIKTMFSITQRSSQIIGQFVASKGNHFRLQPLMSCLQVSR